MSKTLLPAFIVAVSVFSVHTLTLPAPYYSWPELIHLIDSLETTYPAICKKINYGDDEQESTNGYYGLALKISDNVAVDETGEPEILLVGGTHGDEAVGRMQNNRFMADLVSAYLNAGDAYHATAVDIVNGSEVFFVPMQHPRSASLVTRLDYSENPNRDFGAGWFGQPEAKMAGPFYLSMNRQLAKFMGQHNFISFLTVHDGLNGMGCHVNKDSLSNMDLLNPASTRLPGHTIWRYLGSMGQELSWAYQVHGCAALVIEFDNPDNTADHIGDGWTDAQHQARIDSFYLTRNFKNYFFDYMNRQRKGVFGTVKAGAAPVQACVWVGDCWPAWTNPVTGEYQKYLVSGMSIPRVVIRASGYEPETLSGFTSTATMTERSTPAMTPNSDYIWAVRVMASTLKPAAPATPVLNALWVNDSVCFTHSSGDSGARLGALVLDMGMTLSDISGADLKVYTGNSADYEVFISPDTACSTGFAIGYGSTPAKPWVRIGDVYSGDRLIDINGCGISKFRFLRIRDAGGPAPALKLDAVQGFSVPSGSSAVHDSPLKIASAKYDMQAMPNPFNPVLFINYQLPAVEQVTLKVYDVRGHLVENLVDKKESGSHSIRWNTKSAGRKNASGVYCVVIEAGKFKKTLSVTLLK